MLVKNVKITLSPFNPGIEIVGPMVFDVRSPYNNKAVTLVINPNVQDYQDKPGGPQDVEVRQLMVTTNTDNTRELSLDIEKNKEATFDFMDKKYSVKLLNIGKENLQGQDFPFFEFFVEEQ
jgi:hypothetical protein